MNIFVSDLSPYQSAVNLDDKRVIKMTLESAQLLCTVLGAGYRPTHQNHPCTCWAASSPSNLFWLYCHFLALSNEYTYRFNKKHASTFVISAIDAHLRTMEPVPSPSTFIVCPGNLSVADPTSHYKNILYRKWISDKRRPQWTMRQPPPWLYGPEPRIEQ